MAGLVELVEQAKVKNINQECTYDDFLALSEFCIDWELIGQHLKLTRPQLTAIDADNKSTELKRLAVLHRWKELYAFKATYRALVSALISCKRVDAALEVCKFLARKEG